MYSSFNEFDDSEAIPVVPTPAPTRSKDSDIEPEADYMPAQKKKKRPMHTAPQAPQSEETGLIKLLYDKRLHRFLGLLLLALATLVAIFSVSHLRNALSDQAVASSLSVEQMVQSGAAVANMAGPVGAKGGHLFISNALGLGSLAAIVYLALLGLGLLGIRKCNFWGLTFRCLLIAIATSVVLGCVLYSAPTGIYWGGEHGFAVNHWLQTHVGWVGQTLVSLLLIGAVLIVYSNELMHFINRQRQLLNQRRQRVILEREKREKQQEVLDQLATLEPDDPAVVTPTVAAGMAAAAEPTPEVATATAEPRRAADDPTSRQVPFAIDNEPIETAEVTMTIDAPEIEQATHIDQSGNYDPTAELSNYHKPSLDLLQWHSTGAPNVDLAEQEANKQMIIATLRNYGIDIASIEATVGPTVTLFEVVPADGVRIAQIKRLEDDIARSLAAIGIRIITPMPGKNTVGLEVPNRAPQIVSMRSVLSSKAYQESKALLPMAMGTTITNDVFIADLAKMPHLLVAGATGQGKSVGLNAIIASLIYKKHPSELKFVMVDPKMVEFSLYSKLERHFLAKMPEEDEPIITDCDKVKQTLNSLCVEMDNRYMLLKDAYVRSLEEYNKKFVERKLNPEKGHRFLPYIVVIVDEFADLIMMAGKDVEMPIARIAQKARAVGMHMIIATQRPSTNVITGLIKANFPGRIAFKVSARVDSQTILDRSGAQQLVGKGDMLVLRDGKLERVQCAFLSTDEVEAICDCIDAQVGFMDGAYRLPDANETNAALGLSNGGQGGEGPAYGDRDPMFAECARFIVDQQTASTSALQRRFSIGYNKAGRIMDQLEACGVVGPASGSKPRTILVDSFQLEGILGER